MLTPLLRPAAAMAALCLWAGALAAASTAAAPSTYLVISLSKHTPKADVEALRTVFGPARQKPGRNYAVALEPLNVFTRSPAFLAAQIQRQFDFAEQENTPIFFHIDPQYGFEADTEPSPADAPPVKFWKDPDLCEWSAFPEPGQAPRVPRRWFNWGCWVCLPAAPCFASPKFLDFAGAQMTQGVAEPIAARVKKLNAEGKGYLFAGINLGWETSIPRYQFKPGTLPVASLPASQHGSQMEPWEADAQCGYAALHWMGWDQAKLDAEARRRGIQPKALFLELCYRAIHDYNQFLAKTCFDQGIPRERIFTHIVAISTANPNLTSTNYPPVWTAVNPYCTPGFTMDHRGAAVYDLAKLRAQIAAADPQQRHFAAIETYVRQYHDKAGFAEFLHEVFDHGGTTLCIYGAFPKGQPYSLELERKNATLAAWEWLQADSDATGL